MKALRLLLIALVALEAHAAKPLDYDDIYDQMPAYSLSEAYSYLLDYQKQNPRQANTYLQLAVISEKKMMETDPLRDQETLQYWAYNAKLFFNNFAVYYTSGDSRDRYYDNLNIPHVGRKVKDAEVEDFRIKHLAFCTAYSDSARLIYDAMWKAKRRYNNCVSLFTQVCQQYESLNDLLLRYDDALDHTLSTLKSEIDSCRIDFGEYKRLTTAYPLSGYTQQYEMRDIETFRLDGLTNSDFYAQHFGMWDYAKWIDEVRATVGNDIEPLRRQVEEIQKAFEQGQTDFASEQLTDALSTAPFDQKFTFRLCRYDNNSLVRDLFAYLELRRQIYASCADPKLTSAELPANAVMRNLYRTSLLHLDGKRAEYALRQAITPQNIGHFGPFFANNYGGEEGLRTIGPQELQKMHNAMGLALTKFGQYYDAKMQPDTSAIPLTAKGKYHPMALRAIGQHEADSLKLQYVSTHTDRADGVGTYVAGYKAANATPFVALVGADNKAIWVSELRKDKAITQMIIADGECIVGLRSDNEAQIVRINAKGKEQERYATTGIDSIAALHYNELTKHYSIAHTNADEQLTVSLCDSTCTPIWACELSQRGQLAAFAPRTDGSIVATTTDANGQMSTMMANNGKQEWTATVFKPCTTLTLLQYYWVSAESCCFFYRDSNDKVDMCTINTSGAMTYSSQRGLIAYSPEVEKH